MVPLIISAFLIQDPVPALIDRLRSGSLEERDAAETALLRRGSSPAAELAEAAKTGDAEFRIRSRRLLSRMGVSEALIEDLRSDLVPGNARRAREALVMRREEAGLAERLLEAVDSDDDQQAIQAALVLLRWGEGAAALKRAPEILERAVAAFARAEARDYEWVATEVVLRLAAIATPEAAEESFARALRGLPAHALSGEQAPTPLGRALEIATSRKLPLPPALIRRALLNLRHDHVHANAYRTRELIEKNRGLFLPALAALVRDADPQARRYALEMILEWNVELPPGSPEVLAELLGRHAKALPLLCAVGETALPLLEARLASPEHYIQIEAAAGLLTLRPEAWRERVVALAVSHLAADGFRGNAKKALELLLRCGDHARPVLRGLLASRDEQVVACAAAGLAALGEKPVLDVDARRRLYRLAARRWGQDEEDCVVAALGVVDGLWDEVSARLTASGEEGKSRAELLYAWKLTMEAEGWLRR